MAFFFWRRARRLGEPAGRLDNALEAWAYSQSSTRQVGARGRAPPTPVAPGGGGGAGARRAKRPSGQRPEGARPRKVARREGPSPPGRRTSRPPLSCEATCPRAGWAGEANDGARSRPGGAAAPRILNGSGVTRPLLFFSFPFTHRALPPSPLSLQAPRGKSSWVYNKKYPTFVSPN